MWSKLKDCQEIKLNLEKSLNFSKDCDIDITEIYDLIYQIISFHTNLSYDCLLNQNNPFDLLFEYNLKVF